MILLGRPKSSEDWIEKIICKIKDKKNLERQSKKISQIVDAEGTQELLKALKFNFIESFDKYIYILFIL